MKAAALDPEALLVALVSVSTKFCAASRSSDGNSAICPQVAGSGRSRASAIRAHAAEGASSAVMSGKDTARPTTPDTNALAFCSAALSSGTRLSTT